MRRSIATALRLASAKTNANPSDAQKENDAYRKGVFDWRGLKVAIENPKGSERSGIDKGGKRWSVTMPCTYGEFKKSEGADGDAVDVFIGSAHNSDKVFILDQIDAKTKAFDEHKIFVDFPSKEAALSTYEKAFSDGKGKDRVGAVTTMGVDTFKSWLKHDDTTEAVGHLRRASGGAIPFPGDVEGFAGGGSPGWRAMAAPYGLQQLAARLGYSVDDLIANPRIVAAAVAQMEDPRGAKQIAESFMDMVDRNGGGRDGLMKTVAGYDTMTMASPRHIGSLWGGDTNATIAQLNSGGMQPTLQHLSDVGSGAVERVLPEGYTQNFSPAAARVQPIRPGSWQYYKTPSGSSVYSPTWAGPAIASGKYTMTPSGEYMVPADLKPFSANWSKVASAADAPSEPVALNSSVTPALPGFGGASAPKDAQPAGLTTVAPVAGDMSTPRTYPGDTLKSPDKTNTSGSWFSNLFGGSSEPKPESKSADWVEGPLGLMPKWGDDPTALQGFAAGGAPAYPGDDPDFLSMLQNNPHGWGNSPAVDQPIQEQEPWNFPGEARNLPDRPEDPLTPAYEAASPTVGAYGMGQGIGEVAGALNAGEYKNAALAAAPLLMGMALPVPGMKGIKSVPRELNEAGFYSPSLEAAKGIPQESGTLQQMRSMLLNAGAKPKELDAVGFDQAFPDPAAKVSRGQIEEFLRGNRVGLGAENYPKPREPYESIHEVQNSNGGAFQEAIAQRYFNRSWDDLTQGERNEAINRNADRTSEVMPRYESYSTPGGIPGSYREVVTTLPVKRRMPFEDFLADYRKRFPDSRATDADVQDWFSKGHEVPLGSKGAAPWQDAYESSHWPGVTNPLLHYRTKDFITPTDIVGQSSEKVTQPNSLGQPAQGLGDRTVAGDNTNGGLNQNKVRVLDELQSDWAQRARDQGTRDPVKFAELAKSAQEATARRESASKAVDAYAQQHMQYAPKQYHDDLPLVAEYLDKSAAVPKEVREGIAKLYDDHQNARNAEMDLINKQNAATQGVPSAPFISNTSDWVDLGLKQVLSDAVKDPSVSRLAWAPGPVQAQRYGLEKVVKTIEFDKPTTYSGAPGDVGRHIVLKNDSGVVGSGTVATDGTILDGYDALRDGKGKNISEYIGKELSDHILSVPHGDEYDVASLRMGGEGMKHFYGDFTPEGSYTPGIVGTRLLKILKGMDPDAKIEPHQVAVREPNSPDVRRFGTDENGNPMGNDRAAPRNYPSVQITPRMRETIKRGLPLFLALGAAGMGEQEGAPDVGFARGGEIPPFPGDVAKLTDRPPTSDQRRVPSNPTVPEDDWWNGIPGAPGFDLLTPPPPHEPPTAPQPAPGNSIANLLRRYAFNGRSG